VVGKERAREKEREGRVKARRAREKKGVCKRERESEGG